MKREQRFFTYKNHYWYGRLFQRLSVQDIQLCLGFIEKNSELEANKFIYEVNRMFLEVPVKPKNWTLIMELLTVTAQNSVGAGDEN
jgi:hypothetical protein